METAADGLMTADELLRMPRDPVRRELIRGRLIGRPLGGMLVSSIEVGLLVRLGEFEGTRRLGHLLAADCGFILERDPDTVRAPDGAFVLRERMPDARLPEGYFPGPPDLAIEAVAHHEYAEELEQKVQDWLGAGCPLVWVLYPQMRSVRVHRSRHDSVLLTEDDTLTGDPVLPGLAIPVREVFEE